MYKDISFIIPTARPYGYFAKVVVQDIELFMKNSNYTYEIIIYSRQPKVDTSSNIKWLHEIEASNGPVKGYNESFKESCGKYIYLTNDKWHMNSTCLKAIDLLESNVFQDRKFKVTTINAAANFDYSITAMPVLGSQSAPHLDLPQELLHPRFLEQKHKYVVFGFPVLERETVLNYLNGYICHPDFRAHYHDNWLSFYIGEMGEFPLLCEDTQMEQFGGGSLAGNDQDDFKVFSKLAVDLINKKNLNYV